MKKRICGLLISVILVSLAGCSNKPEQIEIINSEEKISAVEIELEKGFDKYDTVQLLSYVKDGEKDIAVFAADRHMANQRPVGYCDETEDILIYNITDNSWREIAAELHEGLVMDAFVMDGMLYYSVFYPFEGRGDIIFRDDRHYEHITLYSYKCEPVAMGGYPVKMFRQGDKLYAVHSFKTENEYGSRLLCIDEGNCEELKVFTDSKPFELDIVSVEDDGQTVYWKTYTEENKRIFNRYIDDKLIYSKETDYQTGDCFFINNENIYLYITKLGKTTSYRTLDVINSEYDLQAEVERMELFGLKTGNAFDVVNHGYYGDQKLSAIKMADAKLIVQPVDIKIENGVVQTEIVEDGRIILVRDLENNYKLYKLM